MCYLQYITYLLTLLVQSYKFVIILEKSFICFTLFNLKWAFLLRSGTTSTKVLFAVSQKSANLLAVKNCFLSNIIK